MGRKHCPGLIKRGKIWHINKRVKGQRISESTRTHSLEEAERYLTLRLEQIRQASVYGVRPKRTFIEAATKFLKENQHKHTLATDARLLKQLIPFIGHLPLSSIHNLSLQPYINSRKKDKVKNRTLNYGLQIIRRILNLATHEWRDENGLSWLATAPKIRLFSELDKRLPYPLNREEETQLFNELPLHLKQIATFAVNTGCRDQEICQLKWSWEITAPILNTPIFIIPAQHVKNRQDRLVILNDFARQVIEERRGLHPVFVFTYRNKRLTRMLNSAWRRARRKVNLPQVRVHDLKHTFGRRLRAANVSFEDRQDLLGHKSQRITTHYSAAEIGNLILAANKICTKENSTPILMRLKQQRNQKCTNAFNAY